jgi:hypothetical protein
MERILQSGPVDIIFTFMTWLIRWNMDIQNSERTLNDFFGDDGWKSTDRTEIVDYYCNKIKSCGYMNKYKTYTIEVSTTSGNIYNLILASQSSGAGNVFNALQKRVNAVTTECIQAATDVITGKSTDLSGYLR